MQKVFVFTFVLFAHTVLLVAQTSSSYKTTTNSYTVTTELSPVAKYLIGQISATGEPLITQNEAVLKQAIETEYYDGTTVENLEIKTSNGVYYLWANAKVITGTAKLIRLSLERINNDLYITNKSAIEACYAVHCKDMSFATDACNCNDPSTEGMAMYAAQTGFLLTTKGIGKLLTEARLQAKDGMPGGQPIVIIGSANTKTINYDATKLQQALTQELSDGTQITEVKLKQLANSGQYILLGYGSNANDGWRTVTRLGLQINATDSALYFTPTTILDVCSTNCREITGFENGSDCHCEDREFTKDRKEVKMISKTNFFSLRQGLGALFAY